MDSYYTRQQKIIGSIGQHALNEAHVLVVGAGGLGATALPYLAAAGVGHLTIVDHDHIEASNLHRQIPFTPDDIGRAKADVAAQYCQARNPNATITAIARRLNGDEWLSAGVEHDLILDCSDDRQLAYTLNDAALINGKPVIFANAAQMNGQLFTLRPDHPDAPCWRCLWPEDVRPGGNCDALGVLGPVPATLGCWQALTAIKLLTGMAVAADELLYYDFTTMRQQVLRIHKQAACNHHLDPTTYRKRHMHDFIYPHSITQGKSDGMTIIDIRHPEECAARALDSADMLVEMSELCRNPAQYIQAEQRYLLVCAAGIRSQNAAGILRAAGYDNVFAYPSAW